MKKLKLLTLSVVLGILSSVATPASAATALKVIVNGTDISPTLAKPVMINNDIYMPVYSLAEALGATVQWDGMNQTMIVTQQRTQISNDLLLETSRELYKEIKPYTGEFVSICNHVYFTYKNGDLYVKYFVETEFETQPADAFMRLRNGKWENLFFGTGYCEDEQYLLDIEKELKPVVLPSTLVLNFRDNLPLDQVVYFNPTGFIKSYKDKYYSGY